MSPREELIARLNTAQATRRDYADGKNTDWCEIRVDDLRKVIVNLLAAQEAETLLLTAERGCGNGVKAQDILTFANTYE